MTSGTGKLASLNPGVWDGVRGAPIVFFRCLRARSLAEILWRGCIDTRTCSQGTVGTMTGNDGGSWEEVTELAPFFCDNSFAVLRASRICAVTSFIAFGCGFTSPTMRRVYLRVISTPLSSCSMIPAILEGRKLDRFCCAVVCAGKLVIGEFDEDTSVEHEDERRRGERVEVLEEARVEKEDKFSRTGSMSRPKIAVDAIAITLQILEALRLSK